MIIYLNGQYVKEEEARLSPFDHGFYTESGYSKRSGFMKGSPSF